MDYYLMIIKGKTIISRFVFRIVSMWIMFFAFVHYSLRRKSVQRRLRMGLLDIEFFHKNAGGFGGYGIIAKNICTYFNSRKKGINVEVILTRDARKPLLKRLHKADVIIAPDSENSNLIHMMNYARMLNQRSYSFLMTVEYSVNYRYTLFLLPKVPLIIWINDPRPKDCLKKISTVSLEVELRMLKGKNDILEHTFNIRESINKIIKFSKIFKRKIIFATTSYFLIERARRAYNLCDIEAIWLPIPIEVPNIEEIKYSSKPTVCFLARLDPQKRPWIFFELAKLFPRVNFLVAGITHFPYLMKPIIKRYESIPNLKFLGLITGEEKHKLLSSTWVLINTSIHEGLPVSFLEAFSYGKPIISCQNPDNLVEKFGIYTGEILGDGYDNITIEKFANALDKLLSNKYVRMEKGIKARKYIQENYSFEEFAKVLKEIIKKLI